MSTSQLLSPKRLESVFDSPPAHWVGDGFPVSSVISPTTTRDRLSPVVLFDYAAPVSFTPSSTPRGVDTHPHRGFETVTLVFQGELEHRDSAGNSGSIGPGDVQWMTAASGVLHEEKHSANFTKRGGVFEVAQLWINLPAAHKFVPPRYQSLLKDAIPVVDLPGRAGTVRLIAGDFGPDRAAASTYSPVIVWQISLNKGATVTLPVPEGFNLAAFVRSGVVTVSGSPVRERQLAILTREGTGVTLNAPENAELLLVGGQPIDEPIITHGPFVLNTPEQVQQAISDYRAGRFGTLN